MAAAVSRRSAVVTESHHEIDVRLPRPPRRTAEQLRAVIGAIMALHQPYSEHPNSIIEEVRCTACRSMFPCATLRLIVSDWQDV